MTSGHISIPNTLGARLAYKPEELRFGTSGRRGNVTDLSQLEIYINVLEELDQPGEWFMDRHRGMLYFWPPEPLSSLKEAAFFPASTAAAAFSKAALAAI